MTMMMKMMRTKKEHWEQDGEEDGEEKELVKREEGRSGQRKKWKVRQRLFWEEEERPWKGLEEEELRWDWSGETLEKKSPIHWDLFSEQEVAWHPHHQQQHQLDAKCLPMAWPLDELLLRDAWGNSRSLERPRMHGETLGRKSRSQKQRDRQEESQQCLHEESMSKKEKIPQGAIHELVGLVPDAMILVLLCVAVLLEERDHLLPQLKELREHQDRVGWLGWKALQVMPVDSSLVTPVLLVLLLLGHFCIPPRRAAGV